jgi:hypothetical protein
MVTSSVFISSYIYIYIIWYLSQSYRALMNNVPFEMYNSYCPALTGYKILLCSLQGCGSIQYRHWITCLLMGMPHLCFSTSSSTFSLVTLKFHCLRKLFFQREFCLSDNFLIFFNIIHSELQHAVSVLKCRCWFLCTFFYLVIQHCICSTLVLVLSILLYIFLQQDHPRYRVVLRAICFMKLTSDEMSAYW